MTKWTKKDIKILCQTISTFWMINRPLGNSTSELSRALETIRQALDQRRTEIVLAGISDLGNLVLDRARENQETADHFRTHPKIYGKGTPEMIDRFERLAKKSLKDANHAERLIEKINTEGLPPEVMSFDPLST